MDIEFIDRLSDDLRALVASIETKAGLEIEVAIDESRAGRYSNEPDPMACVANEFEAQLLIPSPDTFSDGAVLHELLHIQRFLVEGIPQIAVCEHYWRPDLESLPEGDARRAVLDEIQAISHADIAVAQEKQRCIGGQTGRPALDTTLVPG